MPAAPGAVRPRQGLIAHKTSACLQEYKARPDRAARPYKDPRDFARIAEGLAKAGLPYGWRAQ
jgi:hypothetical protein